MNDPLSDIDVDSISWNLSRWDNNWLKRLKGYYATEKQWNNISNMNTKQYPSTPLISTCDGGKISYWDVGDYLALWGCDPIYDHPPRKHGDGYIFYNYSIKKGDALYRHDLIQAIQRQLADKSLDESDTSNLKSIMSYLQKMQEYYIS